MENIFNCLCSLLAEPEMKTAFLEAEGVELMVILMKWVTTPFPQMSSVKIGADKQGEITSKDESYQSTLLRHAIRSRSSEL